MKLLANCSGPGPEWRARYQRRSNDALPAATAKSRFVFTGRSVHSRLPLHGVGPGNVLRRNALESPDCAGDGGGAACPIRFRQAAACPLRILAQFSNSRRDGILVCLQQSRSAASAGTRAEHLAPDNYRHAACLGDRSTTRCMERGPARAPAGPLAVVGHRRAAGYSRPGACSGTLSAGSEKWMVSDRRMASVDFETLSLF